MVLTKELQKKYWDQYKHSESNRYARDQLILHYYPLVLKVAAQVGSGLPQSVEQADLEGYGVFGLIDAIQKFDPDRGFKFETYAVNRIKGSILDELRKMDWVPRSVRARARLVLQSTSKLEGKLSRKPTEREIAEDTDLTVKEVVSVLSHIHDGHMESLGTGPVGGNDQGDFEYEVAANDNAIPFEFDEIVESVIDSIDSMAEKERIVWTLFYYYQLTLNDIGRVLGVTESRVCQILTKAVLHGRKNLSQLIEY